MIGPDHAGLARLQDGERDGVMLQELMARRDATEGQGVERLMAFSPAQRDEMIAVAAYFRAEQRGFAPGRDVEDWCEAAAVIDRLLEEMRKAGVSRADYERIGLRNALRLWTD